MRALHGARPRVGDQHVVPVLQPVQLLDRQRPPVLRPVHPRRCRCSADRPGSPPRSSDRLRPRRRRSRTAEFVVPALGYGIRVSVGIQRVRVVDQREVLDARSCRTARRRSARPSGLQRNASRRSSSSSYTQSDVPLTMWSCSALVSRVIAPLVTSSTIQIAIAHVADAPAVRRELREHQRRRRGVAAELAAARPRRGRAPSSRRGCSAARRSSSS